MDDDRVGGWPYIVNDVLKDDGYFGGDAIATNFTNRPMRPSSPQQSGGNGEGNVEKRCLVGDKTFECVAVSSR
jgi:hypothetical protein